MELISCLVPFVSAPKLHITGRVSLGKLSLFDQYGDNQKLLRCGYRRRPKRISEQAIFPAGSE